MEQLRCDLCNSPATIHRLEVQQWVPVARNYCAKHFTEQTHERVLGVEVPVIVLWMLTLCGVVVEIACIQGGEPGTAIAVPIFFVPLLAVMAWWFVPDAKTFGWLRRLAAQRLLTHGKWSEVNRSAPALILPLGRRVLSSLRARFETEVHDPRSEDGLPGAAALLDRIDPGWLPTATGLLTQGLLEDLSRPGQRYMRFIPLLDRAEPNWPTPQHVLQALMKRLLEDVGSTGDDFLRILPLLDRSDPHWIATSPDVSDQLVTSLMSSLTAWHTRQASPDRFTVAITTKDPEWGENITRATECPDLDQSESALLHELGRRLDLLERLIRHEAYRAPEAVLQAVASHPDLGIRGTLGRYLTITIEWDVPRREEWRSQTGIKKILSSQSLRQAAHEKLAKVGTRR